MKRDVFVRSALNYDADAVSVETGLFTPDDEVRADQSFAEEADINTIVRRFGLTGELPAAPKLELYGDFTGVRDFHSALNMVVGAQAAFMEMPADVRARFANDPGQVLLFLADEKNREEAVRLGLVAPKVEKDRAGVDVAPVAVAKPVPGESVAR